MPYHVVKKDKKFVVEKSDGSKVMGTHDTKADADKQLAALYANEPHAAEEQWRDLHLRAAIGKVRTEMFEGREHLVIPIVALMEGVIHAVNADTPEFVPLSTLQRAAASWNGRPVVLGHPTKDGRQCSANSPEVKSSRGLGTIYNSHIVGTKLLQEAWIDSAKAKQLHPKMHAALLEGTPIEVSVGAFVVAEDGEGTFKSKNYKATWAHAQGDHLAFLPDGRGACSMTMGCGAHRAAMHLITAESIEVEAMKKPEIRTAEDDPEEKAELIGYQAMQTIAVNADTCSEQILATIQALITAETDDATETPEEEDAEEEVEQAQLEAVYALATSMMSAAAALAASARSLMEPDTNGNGAMVSQRYMEAFAEAVKIEELKTLAGKLISDKNMAHIQAAHDSTVKLGAKCDRQNSMRSMGAAMKDCPACDGSGNVNGNPCDVCDGVGQIKAAEAALRAACGCKGDNMTKEKKAEIIAALTIDPHSGFKAGDEKLLEAVSDVRLEELRAAADVRKADAEKAAKTEADLRAATGRLTVIEGKLKAAEEKPTAEQWLEKAPEEIRVLIEDQRAAEVEKRETLVAKLKGLGASTEEELKAMPTAQLETLAKYAKVDAPPSYAGRGMPVVRGAAGTKEDIEDFTPPNPYEADIKALQARNSKAVD